MVIRKSGKNNKNCDLIFSCYDSTVGSGMREQFNILTSFLDASQVYGSDQERAEQLRAFNRGIVNS